jgi:hypothetical protein
LLPDEQGALIALLIEFPILLAVALGQFGVYGGGFGRRGKPFLFDGRQGLELGFQPSHLGNELALIP